MGKHIFSILILLSSIALGQSLEKAGSSEQNLLKNPGFENGLAKWTYTGSTLVKTTINPIAGIASSAWTPAALNDVMRSELVTVPAGEGARSCQAQFRYSWSGVLGEVKASVVDEADAAIVAEFDLPVAATATNANFPLFDCTGGDQFQIKLRATASSSAVKNDTWFAGYGKNTLSISQAEVFGQLSVFPAAVPTSTTSATFTNLVVTTPSYFVADKATIPAGNLFAVTFPNMPAGKYEVSADLHLAVTGQTTDTVCQARIFDGSTDGGVLTAESYTVRGAADSATGDDENHVTSIFSYASTQTNKTFNVQVRRQQGNGSCTLGNTKFIVKYYPLNANNAITLETSGWFVDVNIAGSNTPLSGVTVNTPTEIANGALAMTVNSGSLPATIPCSGTNPSTGLTCAAGNESIGVTFDLPTAGQVYACANFAHNVSMVNGTVSAAFSVAETGNANQIIAQTINDRVSSELTATTSLASGFPHAACGILKFNTAGKKTLRLMYEQLLSGTVSANAVIGDASTNVFERDIHITVFPTNQQFPTPVFTDLQNSLKDRLRTINSGQQLNVAQAVVNGSGALIGSTGNVASITKNATGDYSINWTTGLGAQNICNCTSFDAGAGSACTIISAGANQTRVQNRAFSTAAQDQVVSVTCIGR